MEGGEVFVPKIPSMRAVDLAKAILPEGEIEVAGFSAGGKALAVASRAYSSWAWPAWGPRRRRAVFHAQERFLWAASHRCCHLDRDRRQARRVFPVRPPWASPPPRVWCGWPEAPRSGSTWTGGTA